MPTTLELCKKYFDTEDIYEIFGIDKNTQEKDVKKAYYRLSLKVHPDRVEADEKDTATEKFKIISKLYEVLTDKNKKALYDESGIIDDDDETNLGNWLELWRRIFKPITEEDIDNYKKDYIGSDVEKRDIQKAYLGGKGCIDHMMQTVPFMDVEDEPRIKEIVQKMIDAKEVPEYKIFTNEPDAKKKKRHKKYAKEKREAAREIKRMKPQGSLEQQILKRQQERASSFSNLLDNLTKKYGNENESDDPEFDISDVFQKKKTPKAKKKASVKAKETGKPKDRRVKAGKIKKK